MRVNTSKALAAFLAGKSARPAASVWTDGERIYSYGTCIVERIGGGLALFNETRYSVTTTRQQNALRVALEQEGIALESVQSVPRGRGWLAS